MAVFSYCPHCNGRIFRLPPERHGWFVDTVVYCADGDGCGWAQVETEISEPPKKEPEKQLTLFEL